MGDAGRDLLEASNTAAADDLDIRMDDLTMFGLFAVTAMLLFYALEKRSHWFVLAFACSCVLASEYGFLQGAWPFGMVESVWSLVAFRRWGQERRTRNHVCSAPVGENLGGVSHGS